MDENIIEKHSRRFKEKPEEFQRAFHDLLDYEPGDDKYEEAVETLEDYRQKNFPF